MKGEVKLLKLNKVDLTKLRVNKLRGRKPNRNRGRPSKYTMMIKANRLPTVSRCTVCERELLVVQVTKRKRMQYCPRCENVPGG